MYGEMSNSCYSMNEDDGIYEAYTDQDGQETQISSTVEDVIRATQMLGEQYLWVEACCIIQDDISGSKMEEINAMDVIYSQASLTIVAAAGNSANAGLAGVREGSRNVLQHMEVVRNHSLMVTVSPRTVYFPWTYTAHMMPTGLQAVLKANTDGLMLIFTAFQRPTGIALADRDLISVSAVGWFDDGQIFTVMSTTAEVRVACSVFILCVS